MPPIKELHYFDRRAPSQASVNLRLRTQSDLARANRRQAELALRPARPARRRFPRRLRHHALVVEGPRRLWPALRPQGRPALGRRDARTIRPSTERMIARIMRRFPKAKVVFIARDPVERVVVAPHHAHAARHRRPRPRRRRGDPAPAASASSRRGATRARSSPAGGGMSRTEQFGLFLFDDLVADADGLRRRVLAFLGATRPRKAGSSTPPSTASRTSRRWRSPRRSGSEIARHFAAEIRASGRRFWRCRKRLGREVRA